MTAAGGVTDGRLLRGARTRGLVLRAAVDAASLDGLGGVTFGRLSTATGQSKAGIQTLFASKETLQLATAEFAGTLFAETVIAPADPAAPGVPRLRALVGHWLDDYAAAPLFAGGCFWTATLAEFDSHPGPVRDLLFGQRAGWLARLETEAGAALDAGGLAGRDPAVTAFQLDAVLQAANLELRRGDADGTARARAAVDALLAPH